ncbi:MAG: DinB family protein [Phycisphaerales bacterium]|nr:DinB family protein [Phycisphaerales bacterium]
MDLHVLDSFKQLIANQFDAVLCTLNTCIDQCPDSAWDGPVANHLFCQVVFHTLFCADYYLGRNEESLRKQPFHRDNEHVFRDYEELEDRKPVLLYDKPWIGTYLEFCRKKAAEAIASETAETLNARTGFERLTFTRAELYVYNIRHIQHHSAQLIMRLRLDDTADIPWFKSGWRDL